MRVQMPLPRGEIPLQVRLPHMHARSKIRDLKFRAIRHPKSMRADLLPLFAPQFAPPFGVHCAHEKGSVSDQFRNALKVAPKFACLLQAPHQPPLTLLKRVSLYRLNSQLELALK